jgi:hypothetical protein
MAQFKAKFSFKTISIALFSGLFAEYAGDNETKEQFYTRISDQFDLSSDKLQIDKVEGTVVALEGYTEKLTPDSKVLKRKPIEVELAAPDFLQNIAAVVKESEVNFARDLIERSISEYVKLQFIDTFQTIGDYSLETIIAFRAATGGRGASALDEKLLEAAVKSFGDAMAVALSNVQGGAMMANAAKGRFAQSAVIRVGLQPTKDTAERLLARVDQWAMQLAKTDPEKAEEFAPVHGLWTKALEKLANTKPLDLNSIL